MFLLRKFFVGHQGVDGGQYEAQAIVWIFAYKSA
jgi:hypothetical protein